jgi:uncharacterized damage-inducible protein DinB
MSTDSSASVQAQLRAHVGRLLDWRDAHASFDAAVDGLPPAQRGVRPAGSPHSPWELVEHIRRAQHDILDFSRNPDYRELEWPADYWPDSAAPPTAESWDESVAAVRRDREALRQLAADPAVDLFAAIPHGKGQTVLRELLLAADHTAYHVGQLVLTRRLLGAWPGA